MFALFKSRPPRPYLGPAGRWGVWLSPEEVAADTTNPDFLSWGYTFDGTLVFHYTWGEEHFDTRDGLQWFLCGHLHFPEAKEALDLAYGLNDWEC